MLGKLEKVDIREIWKNEASDFTKWLALPENLALLGEEIGIEIGLIRTEASVGAYSADILAEEKDTDRKIIIENQLETTNHDHLGKIITYGSGFDASVLIWIFKDIREEHRQAIDWLNEKADTSLNIFAIKMEVWRIGDSKPAPKFQVICSPNNWAKTLKPAIDEGLSDTNIKQLEYWTQFSQYLAESSKVLKARKPQPQHWYDLSIGDARMNIALVVSFREDFISCEIYIPDNKELFKTFFLEKDKIEAEIGSAMSWEDLPGKKAARIRLRQDSVDLSDKVRLPEYYKWQKEKAEKLREVFLKYAK
jgi:hypothetical protein